MTRKRRRGRRISLILRLRWEPRLRAWHETCIAVSAATFAILALEFLGEIAFVAEALKTIYGEGEWQSQ